MVSPDTAAIYNCVKNLAALILVSAALVIAVASPDYRRTLCLSTHLAAPILVSAALVIAVVCLKRALFAVVPPDSRRADLGVGRLG